MKLENMLTVGAIAAAASVASAFYAPELLADSPLPGDPIVNITSKANGQVDQLVFENINLGQDNYLNVGYQATWDAERPEYIGHRNFLQLYATPCDSWIGPTFIETDFFDQMVVGARAKLEDPLVIVSGGYELLDGKPYVSVSSGGRFDLHHWWEDWDRTYSWSLGLEGPESLEVRGKLTTELVPQHMKGLYLSLSGGLSSHEDYIRVGFEYTGNGR